jgi:glycosyltransferase involved in cell wall biosynthesis
MTKPTLLFVSPRFLFPADSGGKIRTTQILRGLKGGAFRIVLACPAPGMQAPQFEAELRTVADDVHFWPAAEPSLQRALRFRHLPSRLPIPVASDRSRAGCELVTRLFAEQPAVAVFDFVHSAVLVPEKPTAPIVMFTHNVEAEIFARHVTVAKGALMRALWRAQHRKMVDFERTSLTRFDAVVAVSERDKGKFRDLYGIANAATIPTGVDAEYLAFSPPGDDARIVFCGSMDWLPNVDGVDYFLSEVWPLISERVPNASMRVVGRTPPKSLVAKAKAVSERWSFTGYVDDIRPHVSGAAAFVIPLRVGGGTRIKAFEAMALGCPVVSTTIGVEGLPLTPGEHYLRADSPAETASAIVRLLEDRDLRERLAVTSRRYIEANFSFRVAAKTFENICLRAAQLHAPKVSQA